MPNETTSHQSNNPAPDITKTYTNDDITVVWKPGICIHSKICWTGLGEVFNPRNRPWVNIAGADSARIVEQVDRCPSGALSYFRNAEQPQPEAVTGESIVEVMPNGPLMVYGNLVVKDSAGNETPKHKVTAFCRCGGSNNKPYCDGSHVRIGFQG
jgi:uncharacterized Fe-S cluster protein YjdI